MSPIAEGLSWATAVLLGIITGFAVRDWFRDRDPARAALAVALTLIALVSLGGRINLLLGPSALVGWISVAAFALSGYALLEYRGRIKALHRGVRLAAGVATVAAVSLVFWVGFPVGAGTEADPIQRTAILTLVGVWSLCVLPSAVGFFRDAGRRPPIEGARLRLLGGGYIGIVGVILVGVARGQGAGQAEPAVLITRLLTLSLVTLLLLAVAPPVWLRRRWLRRASERLVRDAAPVGAWYWDEPSDFVVGSGGFYAIFGSGPAEMGSRREDLLERIHPEDRTRIEEAELLGADAPQFIDYRIVLEGGGIRWVRGQGQVVIDPMTGRRVGAFGIAEDITERKEVEVVQGGLAAIIHSSTDAIVGKTLDGAIMSWNPAATQLFGWEPEEAVGRDVGFLISPECRADEAETWKRVSRGEKVDPYETERLRKDGSRLRVTKSISPIRSPGGSIIGVSSIYRDVTGLRRAESKFRGLMEAAPDAMVLVDAEGLIHMVNAQAEKLFGYGRAELIGQPVEILVPERATGVHPRHRAGYFSNPTTRPMGVGLELTALHKDGTEFPVDIALSSLETEEGLIVSAAVRDISDRIRAAEEKKELETRIRQSRLESVGQLAGGIAHDFNNLLAGITIYAKLVEARARKRLGSPEDREELDAILNDLSQIDRARERASTLIQQLLVFSRKEIVKPEVLDPNGVVTHMEDLLRRTLGEDIRLTTKLRASRFVELDPGHAEQIVMNLAVNARDAMPTGGTLLIETSDVDITSRTAGIEELEPGSYVCLTVSDTGTGMPKEVAARAFEPFFTTKPKGEGTGLGLAMVYGIATQAGGVVSIYSEPGLGTTIKVYMVASHAVSVPPDEEVTEPESQAAGETILLVEDEDLVRIPTARFLAESGYEVLSAADPVEALRVSAEHRDEIHLLLTDVIMPEMTGKELAERLVLSRPEMRVVFMSGYSQDVMVHQGTVEPGVVLIEKPFTVQTLLKVVREVISVPKS